MKKIFFYSFLFLLSFNLFIAQEQTGSFFKDAKVNYEKQLDFNPDEAVAFENHTFLIQHRNESQIPILVNVDNAGNKIFRKEFDTFIGDFSTTEDGSIIAVSVPQPYDEQNCYYCVDYYTHIYDNQGTLISKIKTPTFHTKISKDGNYLITTKVEEGEQEGRFEVFDVNTSEKIQLPFEKKYSYFHADFISSAKVVLLTHHYSRTRDKTQPRKSRKAVKLKKMVDSLTIFDLTTNTVEVSKEIRYSKTNFFSTNQNKKSIWVSPNGDKIFITGANKSPIEKPSLQRNVLLALNVKGETIWEKSFEENNEFESVEDLEFLDNNIVLILKFGIINSELKLINTQDGKENWNYKLGPKFSGKLRGFVIDESDSTLMVDLNLRADESGLGQKVKKDVMEFDLIRGELLNQVKGISVLSKSRKYLVIKDAANIIRSIQNEEVKK